MVGMKLKLPRPLWPLRAPLKLRLRKANVCMFHPGRVGSTVVGDLLRQHPKIHWADEVYWSLMERVEQRTSNETVRPRDEDYLRVMQQRIRDAHSPIFGAEVQFWHLAAYGVNPATFVDDLEKIHFEHFIIQNRRNLLRSIVSGRRSGREGRWHQTIDEKSVPRPIHLDPQMVFPGRQAIGLRRAFAAIESNDLRIERALEGRNMLRLTYEDDIEQDPLVAYDKVCAFLGVKAPQVKVRLGRTNPFPMRQMIQNFDEVADVLRGTRHEWMLED